MDKCTVGFVGKNINFMPYPTIRFYEQQGMVGKIVYQGEAGQYRVWFEGNTTLYDSYKIDGQYINLSLCEQIPKYEPSCNSVKDLSRDWLDNRVSDGTCQCVKDRPECLSWETVDTSNAPMNITLIDGSTVNIYKPTRLAVCTEQKSNCQVWSCGSGDNLYEVVVK